ncbi:MAG: hypothetical protein AAF228_03735 [Pseudomonadota bacterium]
MLNVTLFLAATVILSGCTAIAVVDTATSLTVGTVKAVGAVAENTVVGGAKAAKWIMDEDETENNQKDESEQTNQTSEPQK